jgi:hypothetical protein
LNVRAIMENDDANVGVVLEGAGRSPIDRVFNALASAF